MILKTMDINKMAHALRHEALPGLSRGEATSPSSSRGDRRTGWSNSPASLASGSMAAALASRDNRPTSTACGEPRYGEGGSGAAAALLPRLPCREGGTERSLEGREGAAARGVDVRDASGSRAGLGWGLRWDPAGPELVSGTGAPVGRAGVLACGGVTPAAGSARRKLLLCWTDGRGSTTSQLLRSGAAAGSATSPGPCCWTCAASCTCSRPLLLLDTAESLLPRTLDALSSGSRSGTADAGFAGAWPGTEPDPGTRVTEALRGCCAYGVPAAKALDVLGGAGGGAGGCLASSCNAAKRAAFAAAAAAARASISFAA